MIVATRPPIKNLKTFFKTKTPSPINKAKRQSPTAKAIRVSTLNPTDKAKRQNPNDKAIRALTLNPINKAKGQNPNAEALRSRSAVTLNPEPYILKGPSQDTETSLNDFLRPCYVSASDGERAETYATSGAIS